jgi:hypothetical protein
MVAVCNVCMDFVLMAVTNDLKFYTEWEDKPLNFIYGIFMLTIQNMVMVWNFEVGSGKFNGTCTNEYYTQKLIIRLCNYYL